MAKTPVSKKPRKTRAPASDRMKETLDVLNDPELMRQIRESEAHFASGKKGLSFEEVFGEPLFPPKRTKRK